MPKLKTQTAKNNLLRSVRKQRLKYIAVLPSLITLLNGLCGFASLAFAEREAFTQAGYMLLLAMIADVMDGRIARMSKSTSSFGGQLDSLCDMVSFGVAPAFLMLKILEYKFANSLDLNIAVESFLHRFIWLSAAVYVSCAAIRLARFNVENEEDESAHMSFIGLPAPAAAGVIVSLIIFHQKMITEFVQKSTETNSYYFWDNAIIYALPFLIFATGLLMVSRIRYPHIINQYIKGKKPFAHFIRVLLAIGLIIWSMQTALVLIFCGFAASGFLKWLYYKVIRRKKHLSMQPLVKND